LGLPDHGSEFIPYTIADPHNSICIMRTFLELKRGAVSSLYCLMGICELLFHPIIKEA